MRTSFLTFVFILLVFTSCNNEESKYCVPIFPKEQSLKGELLCADLPMNVPLDICCTNHHIVLLSLKDEKLLHFYDKETGNFVSSQVNFGNGANEYTLISDLTYDRQKQILSFSETNKKRAIGISVDESLNLQKVYEQDLKGTASVFRTAFLLNEGKNLIVGHAIKGKPWLIITDSIGSIVSSYATTLENPLEETVFSEQINSVVSPSGSHFARATLFGGILQIFDIKDDEIVSQYIGRHIRPIGRMENLSYYASSETILGYCDLFATNNYLYGVMLNSNQETTSSLVVWDWRGNPIAKWNADRLLQHICIDPDDESILYAATVKNDTLNIERFKIPLP